MVVKEKRIIMIIPLVINTEEEPSISKIETEIKTEKAIKRNQITEIKETANIKPMYVNLQKDTNQNQETQVTKETQEGNLIMSSNKV